MGVTSVEKARSRNYLAYNRMCNRLDGAGAFSDWRRRNGIIVGWSGSKTSKGLRWRQSLARARSLYPSMRANGWVDNPYVSGEGWRIYSVKGKRGWLDLYADSATGKVDKMFVRASGVKRPYQSWAFDGC